jgi:predicted transcriptional regulator
MLRVFTIFSRNVVAARKVANDESGIVTSNTKTATFVNDYIAAVERKELEDAAKVKVNP